MPNTEPPMDSAAVVEFILRTARSQGHVRVLPIGCVSRGRAGKELAEMGDLAEAGAVAFSDDGSPVADAALMRRALEYATTFGLPLVEHCEEPSLSHDGVMHEGWVATRLGLRGIPAAAEEAVVARDIALAELTGAHLHIAHVSTAGSVDLVRRAKERGAPVTAEVTPHHLALTHEAVMAAARRIARRPGLRHQRQGQPAPAHARRRRGLPARRCCDGTIDAIATDHAPHAIEDKLCEFDHAAFGISGLETALALCLSLVHDGRLDLPTLVYKLTAGPVRAFGLERVDPGSGAWPWARRATSWSSTRRPSGRWSRSASPRRGRTRRWPAAACGAAWWRRCTRGRWCSRDERRAKLPSSQLEIGSILGRPLSFNACTRERSQFRAPERREDTRNGTDVNLSDSRWKRRRTTRWLAARDSMSSKRSGRKVRLRDAWMVRRGSS